MAEDDIEENETDDGLEGDSGADEGDKKLSSKRLIIFILLPLILLGGIGGGLYFSGILDGMLGKEETEEVAEGDAADAKPATGNEYGNDAIGQEPGYFYEMEPIIVNLSDSGRRQRLLKISVSLELDSEEDVPTVEMVLPRVKDHFQTYLRELRTSDLQGSAGIYRLRQELLSRVRLALYPTRVRDVLFTELFVQ